MDRTPDAPALTFEGETISYAEMDARANRLARLLRERRVVPGQFVGVCLDRSLEMVVTLLAIGKVGAAYVPLDPEYPRERLAFMLEDSAPAATVTRKAERAALPLDAQHVVDLDDDEVKVRLAALPATRLGERVRGDDLAYAIYTSGSTGRPKGAPNLHRAVVNRLLWGQDTFGYTPDDVVMQKTPYSFDVSVPEFFGPLLVGARIVLARPGGHRDPGYLQTLVAKERVTSIHFVPSMLGPFLAYVDQANLATLRYMMCSGEALPPAMIARAYEVLPPAARVHNLYGPTECAIEVTHWEAPRDRAIATVPIGRAVANTRCYVLDASLEPVPVGVPGELYLAGRQVGVGYLKRAELTAERFVSDPYADPAREPAARMYRTGDRVRWLPDGTIEYLGRLDFQVKLRGVRIELGEIESVLNADPDVSEALALVREVTPGDQRLICYFVPVPGAKPDEERIKTALRKVLPQGMMPSAFIALAEFPTTRSGKVDRQALPLPEPGTMRSATYKKPRTTIEHELVQIWEMLLGRRPIGIREDFFELGGHSLLAVRMLAEVARLRGRHVPLAWLFESSTVERLAARIDLERQTTAEPPLVVLQGNATGTPVAFVHGDGHGGGWYCRRLAPLVAPNSPFYVFPTLGGDQTAWRIETIAARHVAELRKVQPTGPYRIAGYCVSGIVAFEMARQLRALGETVEKLVMIDSAATNARIPFVKPLVRLVPGRARARLERQASLMWRLRLYDLRIRQVSRFPTRRKLQWVKQNLARRAWKLLAWVGLDRRAANSSPRITDTSGLAALRVNIVADKVMMEQERAGLVYFMKPFDGTVDLIYSESKNATPRRDPTREWWRVTRKQNVHPIVAHHIGLITNDLPKMAEVLRSILDRVDE